MTKLNQKGFGTIETVLIVVIAGIVGFTGWFVWHSKQNVDKSASNTGNSQATSTKSTTKPTSSAKYFTIEAWGVRAPYSGSDSFSFTFTQDNKITYVNVISKNLADKYGCTKYGAGIISRALPTDGAYEDGTGPAVQDYAKQYPSDYTIVGGYYYRFKHDEAKCGTAPVEAENQANDTTQALVKHFQTIP